MRLLCLNANTTPFVTATVAAEARAALGPEVEVIEATSDFGPAVIKTRLEHAVAEHAAVSLAARHAGEADALLIAVSFDTALDALREALAIPVIGMSEASIAAARMLGGRIGYVSLGAVSTPFYQERLARYDVARDMAGWRSVEAPEAYAPGDRTALDAALTEAAGSLASEGATVVVLLGAVLAGAARRLQGGVEIPLVDGGRAGALMAAAMARLGAPKARVGSFAPRTGGVMTDVDPALARLAAGRT